MLAVVREQAVCGPRWARLRGSDDVVEDSQAILEWRSVGCGSPYHDLITIEVVSLDVDAQLLAAVELQCRTFTHVRSVARQPAGAGSLTSCEANAAVKADPDRLLEVYNLFGTVTVIVPEGIEVVVRGGGLLASQKIDSPTRPPIAGGPRPTIDTRGLGGTLYVRTRPNATLRDTLRRAPER